MKTQAPIFRGYLFVPTSENYSPAGGSGGTVQYDLRLQDGTLGRIAFKDRGFASDAMWGVRGLMMRDGNPVVLSARSVSAVREIERRQQSPGPPFLQGDLVRVITGLMEDQTLSVAACEREQVILLVEMMGRKVQMRRDIFDVELVAHAPRTRRKTWI
jgi:transcription antitermination factor NusG